MFDYAEIEDSVAGAGLATTIETLKSFGDPTLEPTIDDRRRWIAFLRSAAFAVDRQGTPTERRQSLRQMAFDDEDELVAASVREHARWAGPPRLHMIEERGARRTSEGMVLEGHLRDIRHLALLDDLIVSGDADGTVRIWSTTTGEPTASIELPSLRGLLAAGSGAVASLADGSVLYLNCRKGQIDRIVLDGRNQVSWAMTVLESGRLAIGYFDGVLRTVDLKGGPATTSRVHEHPIRSICPVGDNLVAIGGYDGLVSLCDHTGRPVQQLRHHEQPIRDIASDGSLLCTVDDGGVTAIWRLGEDSPACTNLGPRRGVHHGLLLHDGRLLVADFDGGLRTIDTSSGEDLQRVRAHTARVRALSLRRDGSVLTASDDRTVRCWRPDDLAEIRRCTGHLGWVRQVQEFPDGRLVSASLDKTVRIWPEQAPEMDTHGHSGWIRSLAEGGPALVVSASEDGSLGLWNVDDGSCLGREAWAETEVRAVASNARLVIAGCDGGALGRWWLIDGRLAGRTTREGAHDKVRAVAALDDVVVSAGADGRLRAWDAANMEPIAEYAEDPPAPWRTLTRVGPTVVAAGSEDGRVVLWDVETLQTQSLAGHAGRIWASTMAGPDALITVSFDRSMRRWDLVDGTTTATSGDPLGASWGVTAVADDLLATASPIGVVRLVQADNFEVIGRADLRSAAVNICAATRSDGTRCVIVGGDHPTPTFLLVNDEAMIDQDE